ncbi:MAG: ATP-binding protein, partial [Thermodesulfobacteriota bacterium]
AARSQRMPPEINHEELKQKVETLEKRLRETEEALADSEKRYQELFDKAPIGIFRTTMDGRALFINRQTAKMVAGSLPESEEPVLQDLSRELYANPGRRAELLRELEAAGSVEGFEFEAITRDGAQRCFSMNARISQRFADGSYIIDGFLADITEQKEAEQKRLELEKQLQQAQKMEAVGRLAGGIAHDFNNLLSIVLGYSELMLEKMPETDPDLDAIRHIHEAGERARRLTRQLLAFSRKQVLEIQTMDANKVVTDFKALLQRVIGEDIDLRLRLCEAPLYLKADISQLEQVLMNLAINARDAMPDGGLLFIETAAVELDDPYVREKPEVVAGPYVLISMSDNGSGMDAGTRQRIFEPFFSTKDKERGSGLGLATCYGIIRQHGGHIRVYSEPGQGSTFRIYLPCAAGHAPETEKPGETEDIVESAAAPETTILVVEDDPAVRELAEEVLSRAGYQVIGAEAEEEAIHLAKTHKPLIDLLLTDVVMPNMKGPEIYQAVSRSHPGVKVLYMSGYTDNVIAHQGILEPGIHFIQKPFSVKSLVSKVRQVLTDVP